MSSSSSTATGNDSRSSSPHTPEPSDSLDPVAVQTDFDMGSWYQSDAESLLSPQSSWQLDSALQMNPHKYEEDEQILHLDELIQQNAYDDSPASLFNSPEPPSSSDLASVKAQAPFAPPNPSSFHPSSLFTASRNDRVSATKPIPPPASLPRKQDPSTHLKVVYPPKESCYNLPIMFPSLPEGGAKSRVETQVRVTVDLADSSSSSDPAKYDRVGSWKWLQLPRGTATKRRTRKQGKIDPEAQDILHLTVTVSCASPPHSRVYSCTSCQTREAKRVAKKLAARVRPAQIQDFSSGSVVLPLRITCYCRHHREKVGFHVHLVMMDHSGRIVGTGTSKPIMITDDHKTPATAKNSDMAPGLTNMDVEWSREGSTKVEPSPDARAPSKRKKDVATSAGAKKRAKPYDVASKPGKRSREASVTDSLPSPSSATTRSPTPNLLLPAIPQLQPSLLESDSSGDVPATPPDFPDIPMLAADTQQSSAFLTLPLPTIHRLIPNSGPTHGGTEVTILGANFHPTLQLDCVFGDVIAGSTQRWSDNTLVCILPPRATPGVVEVWLNNFSKIEDASSPSTSLFTYSDESDRALMELALQVVGLKMTGKIEDAKNVAMRIVGNVGDGSDMQTDSTGGTTSMMQVTSAARTLRPLLLGQESEGFEARIIKLLSILEAPVDLPSRTISLERALSHPAPSGQTLLHLASFLGFDALVRFLVARDVDLDARDRNGYTSLHFAAIAGARACATILVQAGADHEIVNALGKTAQEVAICEGLFDVDPDALDTPFTETSGAGDDEEAHWGDAEEDSDDSLQRNVPRRLVNRRTRRSAPSEKRTPRHVITPRSSTSSLAGPQDVPAKAMDEDKQAATLFAMIQRTLAQLPAPQLRNLPGLPQLPEMPAVPWGALPQLPMVFPVLVPWPAFLGGDAPHGEPPREGDDDAENKGIGAASLRAAQDLRGTWEAWEKWLQLAIARTAGQREETPPPMYTPRETSPEAKAAEPAGGVAVVEEVAVPTEAPQEVAPSSRHASYDGRPPPPPLTEQEVNAYGYLPAEIPRKHDRMLLFFWLPILMISLMWAAHSGLRMAFHTLKTAIPLKTGLRG
ncbi:hypothetical protein B0H17DRAFT_1063335 [Mycena rosella]|uniref:IPT/TIG domain-containing protein n=1 Tax=Mycena rosella TaxID=1033263 RepID=A0AAD7DJU3_MYCRO|nr:hypothetical protein B0H17DRAFT_1063335 [Mycena rosella]